MHYFDLSYGTILLRCRIHNMCALLASKAAGDKCVLLLVEDKSSHNLMKGKENTQSRHKVVENSNTRSIMVVGDRTMEDSRNGRRSRGPSPNGHLSDDSSATDDSDHGSYIHFFPRQVPNLLKDWRYDPLVFIKQWHFSCSCCRKWHASRRRLSSSRARICARCVAALLFYHVKQTFCRGPYCSQWDFHAFT